MAFKLKAVETIIKVRLGAAVLADIIAMEKAMASGTHHIHGKHSLYTKLSALAGVDNIDYSDLSDPVVIFSLQAALDTVAKRARILQIITRHAAAAKAMAKHLKPAEMSIGKPASARGRSPAKASPHRNRTKR